MLYTLVYSKDELSTIKILSNEAIEKSVDGQKSKLKINGFNFIIVDTLDNEYINNISFIQNINQINDMHNVFDNIHNNTELLFDYNIGNNFILNDNNETNYKYYTIDDLNNDISNNDFGLSIFLLNSRSFRSNFDNIIQYLTEIKYNFDFIIFTETWLKLHDIDIYIYRGKIGNIILLIWQ